MTNRIPVILIKQQLSLYLVILGAIKLELLYNSITSFT